MLRRVFMAALGTFHWDPLAERLDRFAKAYNTLVGGLNRGLFDLKQARRLSRLWRDVENCGQWPREKS